MTFEKHSDCRAIDKAAAIYNQHDAAFRGVSAAVIMHDGERVGTVAMTHKAACTAYVHFMGTAMSKGRATGYGYDKPTAACADAARKMTLRGDHIDTLTQRGQIDLFTAFRDALMIDGGDRWADALRKAGFTVLQAV